MRAAEGADRGSAAKRQSSCQDSQQFSAPDLDCDCRLPAGTPRRTPSTSARTRAAPRPRPRRRGGSGRRRTRARRRCRRAGPPRAARVKRGGTSASPLAVDEQTGAVTRASARDGIDAAETAALPEAPSSRRTRATARATAQRLVRREQRRREARRAREVVARHLARLGERRLEPDRAHARRGPPRTRGRPTSPPSRRGCPRRSASMPNRAAPPRSRSPGRPSRGTRT